MTYALSKVLTEGSARRTGGLPGRPSAGKTGTTNMNWHTWFVGYTPQMSTAVWVGHSEGLKPMRNVRVNGTWHSYMWGSSIAAPTWKRFMTRSTRARRSEFPGVNQRQLYGLATVPNVVG